MINNLKIKSSRIDEPFSFLNDNEWKLLVFVRILTPISVTQ